MAENILILFYTVTDIKNSKELKMLVTRYNPNRQLGEVRRGFDILNGMLDDLRGDSTAGFDFIPSVNTREGEFAYHIEVDLPGVKKEDISVEIEKNSLVISGKRKIQEELREENYYKVESSFGSFQRSFALPEHIDVENIHAESVDGVLEVIIPKIEKEKIDSVKKINIK